MHNLLLLSLFVLSFSLYAGTGQTAPFTSTSVGTVDASGSSGTSGSTSTETNSSTDTETGGTTGIEIGNKENILEAMMVYPNPANEYLFLSPTVSNKISKIKLYNSNGSLLFESNEKIEKIDLSSYPLGIYYVQINTTSEKYLNKIVKQN